MALPGKHPRGRILKQFTGLGPYIREHKCNADHFFFDCLAVCVNAKIAPEKREFWGWWMVLDAGADGFTYQYDIGLFDKEGNWVPSVVKKKEDNERIEETLHRFYQRLEALLGGMDLTLKPAAHFTPAMKIM